MTPLTLHYRYQDDSEETFHSSKSEILVGRLKKAVVGRVEDHPLDLSLWRDTKVSRPHARFFYELSTWWVEDLNSVNGTFYKGGKITAPVALSPGDELRLGNTTVRVEFTAENEDTDSGTVESFVVNETEPPAAVPPDKCIEILAAVAGIAARSRGQQAMLEGFLREIAGAFPRSERRTILLIEGKELVAGVYWPTNQAYFSFTLARQAIKSHQALWWVRQLDARDSNLIPASLNDTVAALYAPMLSGGRVVGVIHVDSTSSEAAFNKTDLQLISVIANTMGPAIKAAGDDATSHIPSIFVSYAHDDRSFIDRLAADLRRRRIKVWFDEHLKSGEAWRNQITAAIGSTHAFVLVMSPPSVASEYVKWELDTAQSLGKTVFPLKYQESEVPESVRPIQYLNIGANYEKVLDDLVERLYELAGK